MKKLLSLILIVTLTICFIFSLPASVNAYNSEDVYRDSWNYAMSILEDGEFAYFTVYHHSTYDEMVYDYPYFVKANNLLPDVRDYKIDVDYSQRTDTILYEKYKEYYKEKLQKMVEINEKFFYENFKAEGSGLVFSSKCNELIVVYAEKTEIKEIEARDSTSVHYEGKELSQAQWRIDSESSSYFDPDFYEPKEYELVYGLHYYETHEPVDARYEGIGYMYTPLYNHYATPDYILVFAGENSCSPAFSAGELGNYIIQEYNIYYPYIFGYHVIVTEDMSVLTLSEAYEQNIPGIMDVFEDYGLGRLRGDVTGDRKISIKDATAIQKHIAEIEIIESNYISGFALSGQANNDDMLYSAYISDFDKDLSTTIKDVTAIQKHLAGIAQNDPSFDNFVPNPIPDPTTEPPRTDAQITLNGKTYEAQVGDTITLSADLVASKPFLAIWTEIGYDSAILNSAPLDKDTKPEFFKAHCPNLPGGTLYYYGYYPGFKTDNGRIGITSLSEDGIDFTKQKQLFSFDLLVVSGGETELSVEIENISDLESNSVVTNGASIGSFSHELTVDLTIK